MGNARPANPSEAIGQGAAAGARARAAGLSRAGRLMAKGATLPIFPRASRRTKDEQPDVGKLFRQRSEPPGDRWGPRPCGTIPDHPIQYFHSQYLKESISAAAPP